MGCVVMRQEGETVGGREVAGVCWDVSPRGRTSQGGSAMPRKSSRTLQAALTRRLQKQV